jgi:hypothetical protein
MSLLPKINAGNTILNKFSPDYCLDNISHDQLLSWNSEKKAFVNINVSDINFSGGPGIDSIERFTTVGTGTQSTFVLPWKATSKERLIVTIQGVKQQGLSYSVQIFDTFTNLVLSEVLAASEQMEVIGLIAQEESSIKSANFIADGATTQYYLPWVAPGAESLIITIDGIKQQQTAYSATIQGDRTLLEFNGVPSSGSNIEVIGLTGNFGTSAIGLEEVKGVNLGVIGEGLYSSVSQAGSEAILNFKKLKKGNRINLTSDEVGITIGLEPMEVRDELVPFYNLNIIDEVVVSRYDGPMQVQIPSHATLSFDIGTEIQLIQSTANGFITVQGETGVNIIAKNNILSSSGTGSILKLLKIANNEWVLSEI